MMAVCMRRWHDVTLVCTSTLCTAHTFMASILHIVSSKVQTDDEDEPEDEPDDEPDEPAEDEAMR